MYDELVKRLREATRFSESRGYSGMANTTEEAADAIVDLQEDNSALNGTVSNLIGQIAELSSQLDDFKRLCLPLKENRLYKYSDGRFVELFLILTSKPPKEET